MISSSFEDAQADMRSAYLWGAPGVSVSGAVWVISALFASFVSFKAGVWSLLLGGTVIFPLSLVVCRALGAKAKHSADNPLGKLALEGTFWLLAGIAVAFGIQVLRPEWFYPSMLLMIGGRYFTFQTLYGLRAFWWAGGTLCSLGIALALASAAPALAAAVGGGTEVVLSVLLFSMARGKKDAV
ncbi:hypothetical protein FYK34_17460 [Chromobacterium paludis]|uniref:DUF308 domain-containing protein n=2 Tax=Chromobacterium paludis TaxID=2605945 RepID=A0A5C1DMN3_9NEIS|nr:hypothetical protein FYK34_17460 [Chromobacterium paludis]